MSVVEDRADSERLNIGVQNIMKALRITNCVTRCSPIHITASASRFTVRYRSVLASQQPDVRILEVGPRDGLQNIKTKVDTSTKIELIQRLADCGLRHIEATSFVAPKWIPQLADSQDVMKEINARGLPQSIQFPVLTPNMKGFERAMRSNAKEAVVFASASEGFSWKNTNCSIAEAMNRAEEVVRASIAAGVRARG